MKVSSVSHSARKPLSMLRSRTLTFFSIAALSLTSAAEPRISRAQAPLKTRSASSPLSCGDHVGAL
jgi:hypothetical protein